ncbi:MAG: EF-hand domain-containing protein [Bacteroidota bacterium]
MKKIIKTLVLGALVFVMASCASQRNQVSNTQRPSSQRNSPPSFAQLLSQMDVNEDGKLAQSEVKGPLQQNFSRVDSNGDGFITEAELENAPKPQRGQRPPRQN